MKVSGFKIQVPGLCKLHDLAGIAALWWDANAGGRDF
jgi:hypothetical protein